ncbi:LytB protein [Pseudogymnoascus destructans 20631-21]|uniref:4-hydroxy-3-methylbut-2-enyl diphosphate reductase n=1 Tax=Pseudogymnoascus destructans (strain ATCC MYA-4855 / 20631-21) TaxID=658429 RepID=L8GBV5_PSED2|nr:LytB protein [Pseudogymnoascus destructans 20631-21]
MEATRHHAEGRKIVLIGHAGHPEVEGTTGQLPPGSVTLIQTAAEAEAFEPEDASRLAYVTQTTLSVDDTAGIVTILKRRFPAIVGPHKEDICYATTNRQAAVKAIAAKVGLTIVVGAPNSSNSLRLVERAADIPWELFEDIAAVGVTAGASAPETLVDEVLQALSERFEISVDQITTANERIAFNVPRELREPAA